MGDEDYRRRAEDILRNNLCAFSADGRASCAYLYADEINNQPGRFWDPYANDQDWALVWWLMMNAG